MRLPVLMPAIPEQRYSCHGCGECCRDFTIELRGEDFERVAAQGWERELGEPFWIDFAGRRWLRQREDGACVFLGEGGKCGIHARFGLEAKPIACQLFPFTFAPGPMDARVGVSFACGSVRRSLGAGLPTHLQEVRRMQASLPEASAREQSADLGSGLAGSLEECEIVAQRLDRWLAEHALAPNIRWEGFMFLSQSLRNADLARVRGERLGELLDTLAAHAPAELQALEVKSPSRRANRMLRQAVFARVEDPKIGSLMRVGRLRSVLSQWRRSRTWASGRGVAPGIAGWPAVHFSGVQQVRGLFAGSESSQIDELFQRWIRASILGGRAWGSGLYGLPVNEGVAFLALNVLCAAWLARAHASALGRDAPTLEDASVAVGRVDRSSGRARWLGSRGERLRVQWLAHTASLLSLARAEL
ncbi:MAG: YkgJ family cysteine cluster protein [Planctomycetes bacterium]|nr:YkgJ family cysteine cluster protein [Planctomycetota bacterium]